MTRTLVLIIVFVVISNLTWAKIPGNYEKNWPKWRGPYATGVSLYGNPPLQWDETKNVKWKIAAPGTALPINNTSSLPPAARGKAPGDWRLPHSANCIIRFAPCALRIAHCKNI